MNIAAWRPVAAVTLIFVTAAGAAAQQTVPTDARTRTASPARVDAPAIAPEARVFLETALDSLQAVALRSADTDWRAVRDSAFLLAAGARRPAQTYGALSWALQRVDRHSFLQATYPWVNPELVDGRIGYVRVPYHTVSSKPVLADTLQQALRYLESQGACAWIVDLRQNGGGNVWPMYAGVAPLIGDSVLHATKQDGRLVPGALYVNGEAISLEEGQRIIAARATVPYVMQHANAPVAVLIDSGTGSSAEGVALAFRLRPNTRFFGGRTAGLTTGNRGVQLPGGANMVVTVDAMTDRSGTAYPDGIEPDEYVPMPRGFWPSSADAVARRAADWLRTHGC